MHPGADADVACTHSRMVALRSSFRAMTSALVVGKERDSSPVPYVAGIALRSLYCSTYW